MEVVDGQFWQFKRDINYRIRVMVSKDKYAMVRRKGCMPFVISFHELLLKYDPIQVQKNKK